MKKYITLILLFGTFLTHSQNNIENVDADAFKKLIEENKSVLIDLRTIDEITNTGKIWLY